MEIQQVAVTCDDEVGAAMDGYLEELVVAGIAAGADGGGSWDESTEASIFFQQTLTKIAINITVKFPPQQYLAKLGKCLVGSKQAPFHSGFD
jgi:hypothetical protein